MSRSFTPSDLERLVRPIDDFPEPGIVFRDITPLLAEPDALGAASAAMAADHHGAGVSKVVGIESRGFLFGPQIAGELGAGFVPARKPGKLPSDTVSVSYGLEYGSDSLELHVDSIGPGDRVLIVDDVLATGGTAAAAIELVEGLGAVVAAVSVLIELQFLDGRARLGGRSVTTVVQYG